MSHSFAEKGGSAFGRGIDAPFAQGPDELQNLLSSIVEQLSDADRRHGATLSQMQERLAGIGREAQSLRERFPDQFGCAFERIETGMAEMSARVAAAQSARTSEEEPAVTEAYAPRPLAPSAMNRFAGSRFAVKASDAVRQSDAERLSDTLFDAIGSSLPGNVADPWDSVAADALTNLYESEAASKPPITTDVPHKSRAATAYSSTQMGTDQAWLEARFAEIATKIEQSLAEIRPGHGFFALGQRFDNLETNLGRFIDDFSRSGDAESLSEIRTHIGDVAKYLEDAHQQLMRINAIEQRLGSISARLDDVHRVAMSSAEVMDEAPAPVDVSEIVRAAAEETAQKFANLKRHSETSDLRPMLERMMAESHQSGETTAALLDTIQQAMIRLLDRVDALEVAKHGAAQPLPSEQPARPIGSGRYFAPRPKTALRPMHAPATPVPAAAIEAELQDLLEPVAGELQPVQDVLARQRTDLVAEARHTRMRLESEAMVGDAARRAVALGEPTKDVDRRARPATTSVPARKASPETAKKAAAADARKTLAAPAKSAGPSAPSMRLMIVAVTVLAVLAGLWFTSSPNGRAFLLNVGRWSGAVPSPQGALHELPSVEEPVKSTPRSDLLLNEGARGEIDPNDVMVGATGTQIGVAIDTSRPFTAEDLYRARRQQAMAGLSSQLGTAAAVATTDLVKPAALVPDMPDARDVADSPDADARKSGLAVSTPLDLPPATVGPLSLRLAAAGGDPSAAFEVGSRLAEGKGTKQSFADAAKWYQKAASRNFVPAQYRLGTLYERGLGVTVDIGRAHAWYKRAAEQGNVKAMHNLAVLSANQSKESPDYAAAAHWFREAAERGLPDSQFNLAVLYENGLGVEKDLKQAFKWLSLAARGGDSIAVRRRDILRGKLSGAEMGDAEVLIGAWKPTPLDPAVNDARAAGEAWKKSAG